MKTLQNLYIATTLITITTITIEWLVFFHHTQKYHKDAVGHTMPPSFPEVSAQNTFFLIVFEVFEFQMKQRFHLVFKIIDLVC